MARLFDDAQNEYLQIDQAVVGIPFTMACWFFSDSIALYQGLIWLGDKDVGDNYHVLLAAGGDGGPPADRLWILSRTAAGGVTARTSAGYSANTWHHACAIVAAGNDRRVFLDGGSKGTNAIARTPAGLDRTTIGRYGDSSPVYPISGRIAWAAIWNVALSDEEAASLAAGTHPSRIRPANRAAFYPLGGLDPQQDRDIWSGYNMTAFSDAAGPNWADHPGGLIYPSSPHLILPAAAAPGGAISGSTSLTFSASGDLAGKGALAGASSLGFSPSGAIAGTGALCGSSSLQFSPSAAVAGKGALSGTSSLTFSPSGLLAGLGALVGSSSLTFSPSGALAAKGALAGSSSLTFSASGALVGAGVTAPHAAQVYVSGAVARQVYTAGGVGQVYLSGAEAHQVAA